MAIGRFTGPPPAVSKSAIPIPKSQMSFYISIFTYPRC
jgi:hypothetical protein